MAKILGVFQVLGCHHCDRLAARVLVSDRDNHEPRKWRRTWRRRTRAAKAAGWYLWRLRRVERALCPVCLADASYATDTGAELRVETGNERFALVIWPDYTRPAKAPKVSRVRYMKWETLRRCAAKGAAMLDEDGRMAPRPKPVVDLPRVQLRPDGLLSSDVQ